MKLEHYLQKEFKGISLFEDSFVDKELALNLKLEQNLYQLKIDSDEINFDYFNNVYQKSNCIFEDIFREENQIYLVLHIRSELSSSRKRATEIFQRYLKEKNDKYKLKYTKKLISSTEEIIQYAVLLPSKNAINYKKIIKAICNQDFQELQPRFRNKYTYYPELFFVNKDRNIILNIFDDRGCFIIFNDKEELNLFKEHYRDNLVNETH